jgi:uncharacterized coiled-coil protein SlyX
MNETINELKTQLTQIAADQAKQEALLNTLSSRLSAQSNTNTY